jgi:hypothetical protein
MSARLEPVPDPAGVSMRIPALPRVADRFSDEAARDFGIDLPAVHQEIAR